MKQTSFVKTFLFSFVFALAFYLVPGQQVAALEPLNESAPIASFNFTGFTETNPSFTVTFSSEVDETSASDPANYGFTSIDPVQNKSSLTGVAEIAYTASLRQATVAITDPTVVANQEGESYSVQNVKASQSDAVTTYASASPIPTTVPGAPGVPVRVSPANSRSVQWEWSAAVDQEPVPSGIAGYSYELLKSGGVVQVGQTSANEPSVLTVVNDDGEYSLRVWARDAVGLSSEIAFSPPETIDATSPEVSLDPPLYTANTVTPEVTVPDEPLTYSWATTAPAGSLTFSDATFQRPVVTFLQDGTYELLLTVTDAFGNSTVRTMSVSYAAPFIPGSGEPIAPVDIKPIEFIDKVAETTSPAIREVAVTSDNGGTPASSSIVSTSQATTPEVPSTGRADDTLTNAAVAPTAQGWKILGMLWYWWVLIIAIVVSAWLWGRSVGRSQHADDA